MYKGHFLIGKLFFNENGINACFVPAKYLHRIILRARARSAIKFLNF